MMERNELEQIYDAHARCAFALFLRFTHNESDARDLLQDWLVKLSRGHDSLEEIKKPRSYVLRIAYRQAVDWKRRFDVRRKTQAAAQSEAVAPTFQTHPDPDREYFRQSMEQSLAELPPEQQLAVQLRLWDGLSFAEMADVLDVSTNTAASRYRYGIDKLRQALRPIYNELG
jgi:RNA polymerase sigma-70 factor (ECF subfamily)